MQTRFKIFFLASLLVLQLPGLASAAEDPMNQLRMPKVREPHIPRRAAQVTSFGAVADGKTLNTEAIAKGIAQLTKQGGGRLVFPPGIWLTGPIELQSRIELHLEEGALVLFSRDFNLYPKHTWNIKGEESTTATAPIWGEHLEDVAITGRGVVDGNGDAWRPVKKAKVTAGQWKKLVASGGTVSTNGETWEPPRDPKVHRPCLVKMLDCHRLLLDGVTFQNSPNWNLNPTLCEDVAIRNVSVRNPWYSQNGDGLDLQHCRNVIVRDSRFDVGDDGICLKSGTNAASSRSDMPTENVLVENCVVYHAHGGVVIGSEMSGSVRNVRVNDCTFIGTDLGLRFKSARGRGGVVEKIYISNIRMTDIATDAIGFNMFYGGQSPTEDDAGDASASKIMAVNEGTPQFRDIYIQDVVCRGAGTAVVLQGLPEMPIRGIHLRNVSITARNGAICTDAQGISFDHVEILNTRGAVVSLTNCRDVQVNDLTYAAGAEALFQAQGTNNANIVIQNTDLKAAKQDFVLTDGASRNLFQTK